MKLRGHLVKIQLSKSTCSFLRWHFIALTVDVDFVLARLACLTVIPTAGLDFSWSSLFAYKSTLGISSEWGSAIKQESWHWGNFCRPEEARKMLPFAQVKPRGIIQNCSEKVHRIFDKKRKPVIIVWASVMHNCSKIPFDSFLFSVSACTHFSSRFFWYIFSRPNDITKVYILKTVGHNLTLCGGGWPIRFFLW